jgi:hypothetical protein
MAMAMAMAMAILMKVSELIKHLRSLDQDAQIRVLVSCHDHWRNTAAYQATGGGFGLAENGPNDKCRIGEAAKVTSFWNGVTFISHVSKKATKAFLEAPTYVAH